MEIKHLTKITKEGVKTKAFFSIETKNFIINDMRLVQGTNGLFAAFPSREYQDKKTGQKKYQPIIWCKDTDFIKAVTEEAVRIYEGRGQEPEPDIPF